LECASTLLNSSPFMASLKKSCTDSAVEKPCVYASPHSVALLAHTASTVDDAARVWEVCCTCCMIGSCCTAVLLALCRGWHPSAADLQQQYRLCSILQLQLFTSCGGCHTYLPKGDDGLFICVQAAARCDTLHCCGSWPVRLRALKGLH
jgi:hypothetical protein